ncbi:PepSY domain-containing protein [Yoonia sp.]|uniref:PepSY domain-containing protein n=1 Tax=Yoonia sp. TaxID=2212373 RepID=UPI003F6CD685
MHRTFACVVFAAALVAAGAASADDNECDIAMSEWQPKEAAAAYAETLGIRVRKIKIDDGCYEIDGRDSDGSKVEIKLEPDTLVLRALEVAFRDGADPSRYLDGARGPAPMTPGVPADNPLMTPGSAPQVNVN